MSSDNTQPPAKRGGQHRGNGKGDRDRSGGGGGGRRRGGRRSKRRDHSDAPPVSAASLASIQASLDDGEYIVFDLETTGGNPEKNGITEIFAIRFKHGEIVDTFGTLVNPEIPIPPIVRRMTGINNQMVRGAPKIDAVMPDFVKFIGTGILVSHNTIGDMKFVRYFAQQACAVQVENFFLCTHLLVERLAPEAPDKSLKGLAEHFDLPRGELHRAEADSYVTLELFKVLVGKLKERRVRLIEEAVRLQGDMESGMRLGWGVSDAKLDQAPDGPGLLHLYDHERRLLFLSSAMDLGREVGKLRALNQLPRPLLRLALKSYDIDFERTPNPYVALLRECDALDKHRPTFQPWAWHQRQVQTLFVAQVPTATGEPPLLRIGVGPLEGGTRHAFGPVRDRRIASEFLEGVAKALDLRFERDSFVMAAELEPLFLALLAGQVDGQFKDLNRRRRAIRLWFRPSERRALRDEADRMKRLLDVKIPARMGPLLDRAGVLVVPDQGGAWQLHTIVRSRPREMTSMRGDVEQMLRQDDLGRRLAAEIQSLTEGEAPKNLSQVEANRANATLWWLYNGREWSREGGRFVPLSEMPK